MSSSLRDQMLKAGLVTEEQVEEANKKKSRKKPSHSNDNKRQQSSRGKKPLNKSRKAKKPEDDLARFYNQRNQLERAEKKEAERKKKEAARIKKENRKKIYHLVSKHRIDNDAATIRYNFIVGTTVKYLFVTEEQQEQLGEGKLAITFLGGNRCLIPTEIGQQIQQIDPNKIVVFIDAEN
jgi:uncharacterized protein YaiL (DUF2058 family)